MQRPVNPLGGEPLTGEPDAGDPHVRFGGGRGWELNQLFLPLSFGTAPEVEVHPEPLDIARDLRLRRRMVNDTLQE